MGPNGTSHAIDVAVLSQRVDQADEEISATGRRLTTVEAAVNDGKQLMAAINVKMTLIAWIGGLSGTVIAGAAVGILVWLITGKGK